MKKPFIITALAATLYACSTGGAGTGDVPVFIGLRTEGCTSKALPPPDDDLLSDLNLFVYNSRGVFEGHWYWRKEGPPYGITLLGGATYSIYACANLGYDLGDLPLDRLMSTRYHLAYEDEYSEGFPMSGSLESVTIDPEAPFLEIPLFRMMSKLTLSIDRTALEADVDFIVEEVRIGGCPRSASLFGRSRAGSKEDVFTRGYVLSGAETSPLDRDVSPGISGDLSLYMLENAQGDLLEGVTDEREKLLKEGRYDEVCSYIEISATYLSPRVRTLPGEFLRYRFYLGEAPGNFDVLRNSEYHISVRPEGDGLSEDSWRVDKSGLEDIQ